MRYVDAKHWMFVAAVLALCLAGNVASAQNTEVVRGAITDVSDPTVTLFVKKIGTITFTTNRDTEIHRNGIDAPVSALRVGDNALVEYFPDLNNLAKSIDARGKR